MTKDNVVNLASRRPALFTPAQRDRLATKVQHLATDPTKVVNCIEEDLCSQAVEKSREIASTLGEKLGRLIAQRLFS